MKEPKISICRQSRSFAVFDGFEVVRNFESYTNETNALETAKAFVKERTDKEPEVVYPYISSMRITYAKKRRTM